jgi:DNA/RNA non-specific endonuclease
MSHVLFVHGIGNKLVADKRRSPQPRRQRRDRSTRRGHREHDGIGRTSSIPRPKPNESAHESTHENVEVDASAAQVPPAPSIEEAAFMAGLAAKIGGTLAAADTVEAITEDMKGFKAPREFWKVVLRVESGRLHATALVADQTPLIDYVPELLELTGEETWRVEFAKIAKYQVSIRELESRTGLDFGRDVRGADTYRRGRNGAAGRRALENVQDISFDRRAGRASSADQRAPRSDRPCAGRKRKSRKRANA